MAGLLGTVSLGPPGRYAPYRSTQEVWVPYSWPAHSGDRKRVLEDEQEGHMSIPLSLPFLISLAH